MIVDIPLWAMQLVSIEFGCFIIMLSTIMMNTHSCEWEWWHVVSFCISAIVACIVIPAFVVFKILGVI